MGVLTDVRRVVVAHAHPDDESLATGGLLARLQRMDVATFVVTATRGEMGEIAPSLRHLVVGGELADVRERELAGALTALGVDGQAFLGQPPARAGGHRPRRYVDSGMRWVTETVAGPANNHDPDALTVSPLDEVAADLTKYVQETGPDLIVTYDAFGGYGHPDHVRVREAAEEAARLTGVPLAEVLGPQAEAQTADAEWFDVVEDLPAVVTALSCHASQFAVDGDQVIHAGGRREPIAMRYGLRLVS